MRIASMPESELARALLPVDARIREAYLKQMTALVAETPTKVMLGDTTVTDQTTFDAGGVKAYMQEITARLGPSWHAREVTETRDDDVRRIFTKLESVASGYALSVHLSVQYKALLYYKPDARVEQIQRELGRIDESARSDRESIADAGDRIAAERLKAAGCAESDPAELFETLYRDESLAGSIEAEIKKTVDDAGLAVHADRRDSLFAELDSLLTEVYSTTALMIDDARLVTGEDGFLYTADIEKIAETAAGPAARASRDGRFDPDAVPKDAREALASLLGELAGAIDG